MFAMFRQFFAMLTSLFSAGQRTADAVDILAGTLQGMASTHADEVAIQRKKQLITLQRELAALEAEKQPVKQIEAA